MQHVLTKAVTTAQKSSQVLSRRSRFFAYSISRKGSITKRSPRAAKITDPVAKVVMLAFGSALIGFGVALMIQADLGLPPFDVLLSGVSRVSGLSHGQSGWVVGAVLYAVAALVGQRPTVYNVLFSIFVGYAVDTSVSLVNDPGNLSIRILFVLFGTLLITSGVSAMVFSGLKPGSFELFMAAAEERGRSRVVVRSGLEWGAFLSGIALGGVFATASVFTALAFGPIISAQLQFLEDFQVGRRYRLAAELS